MSAWHFLVRMHPLTWSPCRRSCGPRLRRLVHSAARPPQGSGLPGPAQTAPDLGRLLIQLAPRGFGFVSAALDRLGASLDGWARDDVLALGAAAATRIQLLRLAGNSLRARLAVAVEAAVRSNTLSVYLSSVEVAALQAAEPLLHPSVVSSLARLQPIPQAGAGALAGTSGRSGAALLVRDAELAAAAYAHSTAEFCARAGIAPDDIITCSWDVDPDALVPAHCLLVDHPPDGSAGGPRLVLVIRGTKQLGDALLDVSAAPEPLRDGQVHSGILLAARALAGTVGRALQVVVASGAPLRPSRPDAETPLLAWSELTLVGHSLGGGVAAVLGLLAQQGGGELALPASLRLRAVAFGCPAVLSADLAAACRPWLSSVLHADDVLPRLNIRAATALRAELAGYDAVADFVDALAVAYPREVAQVRL